MTHEGTAQKYDSIWSADQTVGEMTPALINDLKSLLPPGSLVLDLGAGLGRFSIPMAEAGFKVTAVDVSVVAMCSLEAKAKGAGLDITTSVGDICTQLDTEQYFAAISAILVLHYLRSEEAETLISAMQTHTVVGGVHILNVYSQQGDTYQENLHSGLFFPKDHSELIGLYPSSEWEVVRSRAVIMPTPDSRQHNEVMHCLMRKK